MAAPPPPPTPATTRPVPFGGDWQLDAEPDVVEVIEEVPPPVAPKRAKTIPVPPPVESPATPDDPPPPPLRIVEAMLFVGGTPLTATKVCSAIRGLTADGFRELVDQLARSYRGQNRPYTIAPRDGGFVLTVKPAYRAVRAKLYGGPRETRLSQPALDVLSLVAYRQPVTKADLDAARGADCGGVIRQLVRVGLVAMTRRPTADQPAAAYGTTPRFLDVFGLSSPDDLPKLG